jgi:site-specific recombinase XerD
MNKEERTSFNVLFYIKRSKPNNNGEAPIYLRITCNGKRAETSLNRWVIPDSWNSSKNRVKGNGTSARHLNETLSTITTKIFNIKRTFIDRSAYISARSIMNEYLGKSEKDLSLLQLFQSHNDKLKVLVEMGKSRNTYKKYKTALNHVSKFMNHKFGETQLPLKSLNNAFIADFDWYLASNAGLKPGSVNTNVAALKKIVRLGMSQDIIQRDPFINYKFNRVETERKYLTPEEFELFESVSLDNPKYDRVKDVFMFCCYTGLSYCDVQSISKNNIQIHINGQSVLTGKRKKTQIPFLIPLLKPALDIIGKYENLPVIDGKLLPVISNQKTNDYLKIIGKKAEIGKSITFHMARHTFATTVTLLNDIPMETVKTMMAHRNIRTTQIYGKILDKKVVKDMAQLDDILSKQQISS